MKHKLAFFTSSRSDMTILEPLLNEIKKNKDFDYLLFVHGTHLEKNHESHYRANEFQFKKTTSPKLIM